MNADYYDWVFDVLNTVTRRKYIVERQIEKWQCHSKTNCSDTPDTPCCLLQTELGLLKQYADVLSRELWHIQNGGDHDHRDDSVREQLASTVDGMLSSDWERRLKAEWAQLCIRMEALDNFRDRFREDNIDFAPKWDERLLCDQLRAMRTYRDCLLCYAKLEGIELDMTLYDDSYIYDYYFKPNQKGENTDESD